MKIKKLVPNFLGGRVTGDDAASSKPAPSLRPSHPHALPAMARRAESSRARREPAVATPVPEHAMPSAAPAPGRAPASPVRSSTSYTPPDRSGETFVVAYPFSSRERGYADLEKTDFAPNIPPALNSVLTEWNREQEGQPNHKPRIRLAPVDLYAAYQDALPAFEQRLKSTGFLKNAPAAVKYGIDSHVERRHIIENADYKRQDRKFFEPWSDAGQAGLQKLKHRVPILSRKLERVAARHEESRLVHGRRLFEYAHHRLRTEALAVSDHMVGVGRTPDGHVKDWQLSFPDRKALDQFFSKTFNMRPLALTLQERTAAVIDAAVRDLDPVQRLALDSLLKDLPQFKSASAHKAYIKKQMQTLGHLQQRAIPLGTYETIRNLRLSEATECRLRAEKTLRTKVPMGVDTLENAESFRRTWSHTAHAANPNERVRDFKLADGSLVSRTGTPDAPGFTVALGDASAVLSFEARGEAASPARTQPGEARASADAPAQGPVVHDITLQREGRTYTSTDPDFEKQLGIAFNPRLLNAVFGGHALSDLRKAGSFGDLHGRLRAGVRLEDQLQKQLRAEVHEATRQRLADAGKWQDDHGQQHDAGPPIMFQGGGNSYNKALGGTNWGTEDRAATIESVFQMAEAGELFAHGSCGFHQESGWMFGGSIITRADGGGKTYRYDDDGGDPYEGEAKRSYMMVQPFTDTAGVFEKKIAPQVGDVPALYKWAERDIKPLTVPILRQSITAEKIEQGAALVRDAKGQIFAVSDKLRLASYETLDGEEKRDDDAPQGAGKGKEPEPDHRPDFTVDPLNAKTITLREELDEGMVLADDLARPVVDPDSGERIKTVQTLTLEARYKGQPLTRDVLDRARAEFQAGTEPTGPAGQERHGAKTSQWVDAQVASQVQFTVVKAERMKRVPLTQSGKDGRPEPSTQVGDGAGGVKVNENGEALRDDEERIAHTYQRETIDAPTAKQLLDYRAVRIHCVHGQNLDDDEDALAPGHLEYTGHSIPREGVQADTPLNSDWHPAGSKHFGDVGKHAQGRRRDAFTNEAAEGRNKRTTQPHTDMHEREAKGTSEHAMGEDPLVRFPIDNEVDSENNNIRNGIREAIQSGIALRGKRQGLDSGGELVQKLREARERLDLPHAFEQRVADDQRGALSPLELARKDNKAAEELAQIRLSAHQNVYQGLLRPVEVREGPAMAPGTRAPRKAHIQRTVPVTSTSAPSVMPPELPADQRVQADMATRTRALTEINERLDEFIQGLEGAGSQTGLDLQATIQRYFRPWPDRMSLAGSTKASAGMADVAEGFRAVAESAHHASAFQGLTAFTFLGCLVLGAAGAEGAKDGMIDIRRLKALIPDLQAYQGALKSAQEALASHAGETGQAALDKSVNPSLDGVNARLDAANRQLIDRCVSVATSGTLGVAGAVGLAGGITSLFPAHAESHAGGAVDKARDLVEGSHVAEVAHLTGAGLATKALGAVYGGLVGGFGAVTAAQQLYRLDQLQGLPEAVEAKLGKDNALRYGLQMLLGHEKEARRSEIASRVVLSAAGFTSMSLNIAGAATAWTGAGAFMLIPGIAMGAATAAAFRPVRSRQRGLAAVGGVEKSTGLPIGFLNNTTQLNHAANKLGNQFNAATWHQREMLQTHLAADPAHPSLTDPAYTQRLMSTAAAVVPDADKTALVSAMLKRPQAAAQGWLGFMQRLNGLEFNHLQEHRVPNLFEDVQALHAHWQTMPDDQGKTNVASLLKVKAQYCAVESKRLADLQHLDKRLNDFYQHWQKDFLDDPALKTQFEDLQIDFIMGHDLTAEALSRSEHAILQAAPAAERDQHVRAKLREGIHARFAQVFAKSYPAKLAYERIGVLEIARMMFMKDARTEAVGSDPQTKVPRLTRLTGKTSHSTGLLRRFGTPGATGADPVAANTPAGGQRRPAEPAAPGSDFDAPGDAGPSQRKT